MLLRLPSLTAITTSIRSMTSYLKGPKPHSPGDIGSHWLSTANKRTRWKKVHRTKVAYFRLVKCSTWRYYWQSFTCSSAKIATAIIRLHEGHHEHEHRKGDRHCWAVVGRCCCSHFHDQCSAGVEKLKRTRVICCDYVCWCLGCWCWLVDCRVDGTQVMMWRQICVQFRTRKWEASSSSSFSGDLHEMHHSSECDCCTPSAIAKPKQSVSGVPNWVDLKRQQQQHY